MSIASVQILELPPERSIDEFINTLRDYISQRLHLVPYLTNIVQWDSGWLGHPNWIAANSMDIKQHIYAVPVPAPGGRRELEQMVAQLHQQPLDRSRPLWDIAVLTGLENGRIAYYNRVHHACLDGMAAQASTQLLMDSTPDATELPDPLPATAGTQHSATQQVLELLESMATEAIDNIVKTPARTTAVQKLWQRSLNPSQGLGALFDAAPHTILNRRIDKGRTWAMGELSLGTIKDISKSTKSTINDVFLSICGGALRRYLSHHGALPSRPLLAGCPVSLRRRGDAANNNQVTMMKVSLASNVSDPVQRLQHVGHSARMAKQVLATTADLLPGNLTAPGLGAAIHGAALFADTATTPSLFGPPVNVVISNVPGPRHTLYSNGARVLSHYPVSIPAHNLAVNITVQSYEETLYVGITADAKVMPDADLLRDELLAEYSSLQDALRAEIVRLQPPSPDPVSTPQTPAAKTALAAGSKQEEDNQPRVA